MPTDDPPSPIVARTQWWAPGRADWQVSAAFAVGSACFAVGAIPVYAAAVGAVADGVTYFVGSLFFTTAALLQVLLSAGVIRADESRLHRLPDRQHPGLRRRAPTVADLATA